jgi:hypothetical protein
VAAGFSVMASVEVADGDGEGGDGKKWKYNTKNRKGGKTMPRGDGTGPAGMGPMTGRAAGYCAGYPVPGFMNPYSGRMGAGFGWGRGFGRGMGRWGYSGVVPYGAPLQYGSASYAPEQELEFMQNQAKVLGDQLEQIQKRISELEADSKKKDK